MPAILFCDLATICGYAVGDEQVLVSGEWDLKPSRSESPGMRTVKFRRKLEELHKINPIGHAAYERVQRHVGVYAAHCYGALEATFQVFCAEHGIPYEGVPVSTLKKFWTGKGNASKQDMIDACLERTGHAPTSHNQADAVAGWHWARARSVPTEEAAE